MDGIANRKIVYYVACSLDGFIAGKEGDISGFVSRGSGIKKYMDDLLEYDTVIMGKRTYEFGYRFGLQPGKLAYPHMKHYIFSDSLQFEDPDDKLFVCKLDIGKIKALKANEGSDIYLCGGGQFAGWLLENEQIDVLKIKLNPFIQGEGIKLFGCTMKKVELDLQHTSNYDHGLQILTYRIQY